MSNHSPEPDKTMTKAGITLSVILLLAGASLALAGEKDALPAGAQPQIEAPVFEAWLARGPQYLLSQVVPVPVTEGTRFHGFRLTQWFPGHPGEISSAWVRPGDVITRINGRSVERPDQFLYLWKRLGEGRRLVIEGWRPETSQGQQSRRSFAVTFDIVDPPKSTEPGAPAAATAPARALEIPDIPRTNKAPAKPRRGK